MSTNDNTLSPSPKQSLFTRTANKISNAPGETILRCAGATLTIPGLIDTFRHVALDATTHPYARLTGGGVLLGAFMMALSLLSQNDQRTPSGPQTRKPA